VDKVFLGAALGVVLGCLNYWQLTSTVLRKNSVAAVRKNSFWRFLAIFAGFLAAIHFGGALALVAAALSMLVVNWVAIWRIAKTLAGQGGENVEQ
jgi:NhaP-type Na+/H+ or K+/H+ antiporter